MPIPPISLSGKRALVTGGASGIGAVTAKLWRELGAQVAIADVSAESLTQVASAAGLTALTPGDVRVEKDVDRMISETVAALGGLDIVFNSAGLADAITSTVEQDIDRWQRVLDTNLRGTYLVCRAAARVMLPNRSGAIVNVASVNGTGGFPRRTAYGASKAGVLLVTKSLACEWGGSGIRVNAVAPGYIRTPMVDQLIADRKIDVKRIEDRTPLGRLGTPEEVAKAAAFLVSDWAEYITGTTVYVDGGWTAFGGAGDVATA
jgi:NAD(P)-dependent dehydrogenase (short-subunit alcohol dehydrogenase family)